MFGGRVAATQMSSEKQLMYNAAPMTLSNIIRLCAVAVVITIAVPACMSSQLGRVIYQQGHNVVRVEGDPFVVKDSEGGLNTQPTKIETEQLALILRGLTFRIESGVMGKLLRGTATMEAVFDDQEINTLGPLLADALAQANPTERVRFTYWSSKAIRRNAPIAGTLAVRDPELIFALEEHPAAAPVIPDDTPMSTRFTLGFIQTTYVKSAAPAESLRNLGRDSSVLIDYKRFLQGHNVRSAVSPSPGVDLPTTSTALSAEPSVLVATTRQERVLVDPAEPSFQALSREIKQLTDLNEELFVKVRRLTDQLAEAKQLLADKDLELSRLTKKSGDRKPPLSKHR